MTAALSDLLIPLTKEQIRQRILSGLLAAGFPVSDWAPTAQGGIENGLIDMVAGSLADLGAAKLADGIASGFLDFAVGPWLTFWAKRFYLLDRNSATTTIQAITLTSALGAGPYTAQPGELVVIGTGSIDGANRYRSVDAVTIPAGAGMTPAVQPVVLNFQAENPGSAYDDAPDTIRTLVTSLPGVAARNARVYTPLPAVIVAGGGSKGTILPLNKTFGVPPTHDRFRIRFTGSGNVMSTPLAQFVFSTNDGATWSAVNFAAVFFDLGDGCVVFMVDSPTTSPSFVVGDEFFWASTSILQQGSDEESDARLIARCRARWLTLSDVPSSGTVELWAKQASPEVARVKVLADTNTANRMLVYLGSSSGRAAAQTVVDVQTYVTARLDPGEFANVLSVDTRAVAVTGTVQVPRLRLAEVQTAAERNWTDYLASIDIAGTARLSELEQAVMDAGATDYTALALVGGTPNILLGTNEVAVPPDGSSLVSALFWDPI